MSKTFDSTQSTVPKQSGTGILPVTRDREEVRPMMPPSDQAAAGPGLLSELQLSLRTECAQPALRTSPSPNKPPPNKSAAGSGLLGAITALSGHGVRLPALRTSPAEGPWTAEACCRFPGASPLARHQSSHPSIHPSPNQPFSPSRQPTLPTRIPPNKTITLQTSHFPPHQTLAPAPRVPTGHRLPKHRSDAKWHGRPACDPKPEPRLS